MKNIDYQTGAVLHLTKMSASRHPVSQPGSWDGWEPGRVNSHSLPVDYTLRGVLLEPIVLGERIHMHRTHRNGIAVDGVFVSSPLLGITNDGFIETWNSIYRIEHDS